MSFKGKVAVVTGSTSGIGEGCAQALAKAGAAVAINDHLGNQEGHDKAKALSEATGAPTAYIAADMTKPDVEMSGAASIAITAALAASKDAPMAGAADIAITATAAMSKAGLSKSMAGAATIAITATGAVAADRLAIDVGRLVDELHRVRILLGLAEPLRERYLRSQ